ncbi:MAG TPA: biotin--[acetyl-CoA-carboxylase] ligase [Phycisphaerae bacterium]|nr:biotin--[acetyl-CoA-carboxylase] ligase [Phycisphaerae bacterium]
MALPFEIIIWRMQEFHFDSVDSTNDAARRLIAEGRLCGRGHVLAREQTAGRGTHGRTWVSPRDAGIYLSVVYTQAGPASADLRGVTTAAGLACAEALRKITGLTAIRLRPINDLIVHCRKLGGILTECEIESGELKSLIVGVGINTRIADRPLPPGAMAPICLEECLGLGSVSEALTARIVNELIGTLQNSVAKELLGGGGPAERFPGVEGGLSAMSTGKNGPPRLVSPQK